ncbi:hypothetical protein W97_07931 [Coniosporium apollinis CBS 100218]|uniref:Rhodopsin domain-containing protein n=1 Tax=Coniosporium apollinis (strain CBS 100218) TaxID=1168221 RepID=R7Z3K7_CONA1|nr:uncharacterized protein W97_07931 [Coniosporium apollinis CBS 100218]EON68673.1 hypothetical protein W97_07931 [Coniosporium apollinis CBS 100218]
MSTPPGYHDDSAGPTVITVAVVFGVLTTVVVSVRLATRIYVVKSVGADDALIAIAGAFSWVFITVTILSVKHGLGDHIEHVMSRGMDNLSNYGQLVWFSSIFYLTCLFFIKASVLALYMRLGDHQLQRLSIVVLAICIAQALANVLVCIFQCSPIPAAWDMRITEKECVNINAFYLANAAGNILTDIMVYTLPIRLVWKLQVPPKQKVALVVMLCLGLFTCISSIIRITYIPIMLKSLDATYVISGAMYWSVIETNVGILAASIPSFKALAKRYLPRLLDEYYSNDDGSRSRKYARGSRTNNSKKTSSKMGSRHRMGTDGREVLCMDELAGSKGKHGIVTNIDLQSGNSSEERLNVPDGKIMASTHISTHVEGNKSDAESSYEEGLAPSLSSKCVHRASAV